MPRGSSKYLEIAKELKQKLQTQRLSDSDAVTSLAFPPASALGYLLMNRQKW